MKRSRCRPPQPPRWRCGRSRSSPTRRASPASSIRSAGRIWWKSSRTIWRRRRWPTSIPSTGWVAWWRRSSAAIHRRRSPKAPTRSSRRWRSGKRFVVGVNAFVADDEEPIGILYIDQSAAERQLAKLAQLKARRNNSAVQRSLDRLKEGAANGANTMPLMLDAVRAYATVGEMCDALRDVWGEYEEISVI